jgi:hypothetical protein
MKVIKNTLFIRYPHFETCLRSHVLCVSKGVYFGKIMSVICLSLHMFHMSNNLKILKQLCTYGLQSELSSEYNFHTFTSNKKIEPRWLSRYMIFNSNDRIFLRRSELIQILSNFLSNTKSTWE